MAYRDRHEGLSRRTADPFQQFRRLTDQMDRWFEQFGVGRGERAEGPDMWAPESETFLRDNQFVVRIDLPGLSKDDLNVEVTDDSIVIHGERQQTHQENRDGYYRSERSYGRFYREIPLPDGAETETAKANYRDGVLEVAVNVPPRTAHRTRRIEIGGHTDEARERKAADLPGTTQRTVNVERTTPPRGSRAVAHDRE